MSDGPKISFIIPTLNAAALLDNCLASIARQTWPRDRYQIIIADARSKDATRDIAKKYGAIVLDDDGDNMEEGKRLALAHATGDYIVFVDADNELTHPDFLELAVNALAKNPQSLGVESYYLPSAKMSSFCAYVTHRLHISDPVAWLMSVNPKLIARDGEIERWTIPGESLAYPLGANGFVFRKADLDAVRQQQQLFQDTHVALHLMQMGKREWLRIRGRGVHHYYIQSLGAFLKKRRRAMVHFFNVREKSSVSWAAQKPAVPAWLAALYCVTLIGPLFHTLLGIARDRDWRWVWHTPASVASLLGILWGWQTQRANRHNAKLIADLQPKQTLKSGLTAPTSNQKRRVVCLVNGIYSSHIGGGDIYFSYIARAALEAGYELHFFGGHAFKEYMERQKLPMNLTLTDSGKGDLGDVASLPGQLRLLFDFSRRLFGALRRLREIRPDDCVYAMSDYWFDSIPLLICRARAKIMYLGMMAPTFREVLTKGRPDVASSRLASIYYWTSQQFSVRAFCCCARKKFTYGHPEMRAYLRRFGYAEAELALVSNGMDISAADRTPEQKKEYDLVWAGRVHPQKGIDDLLATLVYLAGRLENFRAVMIGKSKETLEPRVRELGLAEKVTFAGLVSEEEKFRLLKASRVFAMPSRYESWGIVIGEALASGTAVVAYELQCYRLVFGEFVRYVPPFDREEFMRAMEREILEQRAGRNYFTSLDLPGLKRSLSWASSQESFREVLAEMTGPV